MDNLARRVGRFAIVPVLAGAAVFGLAAPAVAAPPEQDPQPSGISEDCGEPVDGATVCVVVDKSDPAGAQVSALVRSEGGTLRGALVVLEACDGVNCYAQEVATGEGAQEVSTKSQQWGRGVGYYRANASWVDDKSRTHTGVTNPE